MKNKGYNFLKGDGLSYKAKGLLAAMLSMNKIGGISLSDIKSLDRTSGDRSIRSTIRELMNTGHCYRKEYKNEINGRVESTLYFFVKERGYYLNDGEERRFKLIDGNVIFVGLDGRYVEDKYVRAGVYAIDNLYIGESGDIVERINKHIATSLAGSHFNKSLSDHISSKINNHEDIFVYILSENQLDEGEFIEKYINDGVSLFNSKNGRYLSRTKGVFTNG